MQTARCFALDQYDLETAGVHYLHGGQNSGSTGENGRNFTRSPPSSSGKENIVDMFALLTIAAALVAVFALECGIAAVAFDGEVVRRRSQVWMGWLVACQAAALLFAALMLFTSAHAATPAERDCIYDYRMITDQECRAYRTKVLRAKSDEERLALRDQLHKVIDARARERGVSPDDWRGLAVTPQSEDRPRY